MNIAFIPVRGGSKSIPLKNIKPICGKPLVYWTIKAACNCKRIDYVYVATDSQIIAETINTIKLEEKSSVFEKVVVVTRSAESASDTASTEFAMLEFANKYEFDNIVLVQATSPLLKSTDLDKGFELFFDGETDSVISVVAQKRFNWNRNDKGYVDPANYDINNRPRRQDFKGYLVENGAFYITSKKKLLSSKNRLSGRIKAVEMCEESFFEIDEPSDWLIIEELMKKDKMKSSITIPNIELFLTDCDGCLTDGGMYYSEHGDELKKFNTRDGMGFSMLQSRGILTGIVTSENVKLNERRASKLKIDILEVGCRDKASVIKDICKMKGISLQNVCYIGDDLNDLDALKMVGLGCAPADSIDIVKRAAKYVTKKKGGEGVIREVADIILNLNN